MQHTLLEPEKKRKSFNQRDGQKQKDIVWPTMTQKKANP
jgi:hypothetical protein